MLFISSGRKIKKIDEIGFLNLNSSGLKNVCSILVCWYVALILRVQNMNYNLHFKGRPDQARSKTHVLLEQDLRV